MNVKVKIAYRNALAHVSLHPTFIVCYISRVCRRRLEMYYGYARLCVCLSAAACLHYYTEPDVILGGVVGDAP